jgi:PAP2 superfamily
MISRRHFLASVASSAAVMAAQAQASLPKVSASAVLHQWYDLLLELVRHTPTYSPPVASRAFAYLAVTAYEAVACCDPGLVTQAGQLQGLVHVPASKSSKLNPAVVLHAALSSAVMTHFSNTGPLGQRAMQAQKRKFDAALPMRKDKLSADTGAAIAAHILAWSKADGGAEIVNLGFAENYVLKEGKGHWVPTSAIRLQQTPLLPNWGTNRSFAMPQGTTCALPPPPAYSEDKGSAFYQQALEVRDIGKALTKEQKLIARFWSDDPMLSPTPPGHWVFIANDLLKQRKADVTESVDVMMRLGVAVADAFIGCWQEKFRHDVVRPVSYIRRVIDKTWEPLLITPPFPEYPSGHSTQSGAAEVVLTQHFGSGFAFEDRTHVRERMPARAFASFTVAAEEAAMSRLYGGIHFRSGNENGLVQGRCIGAHAAALKTRIAS